MVNLETSCLIQKEKDEPMKLLYKHEDVFSLRDEIDICPNIEVEIDMGDKSTFFLGPYHMKKKDKQLLDKEMKRLVHLGILKDSFSQYSSTVMLISRKLTWDKTYVSDFRHLNTRIANLLSPLVRIIHFPCWVV